MPEETQVHVVRHGEVHNPTGILYGRLPGFHLSATGAAQAAAVADALADRDIVAVIASPLQRAQETAAPIAARHDLAVETDPDLIESANFFEGRRVGPGDGAWRDPRVWWQLRNPFTPSWGEPYVDIAARMTTAVDKARVRGAGHEVVCVSHQLPVWTLRLYLTGKRLWHDPRRRDCALASVTSLIYDGDRLVDVVYSQPAAALTAPATMQSRATRRSGALTMRRLVIAAAVSALLLTGCSGRDAVAQGGTFEFVSPGGKTDIFYDPPASRGRPGPLSGPELADPARSVSLDDFPGQVVVVNVWGQWCGPCRAEVSQLQRVYDATRGAGVSFLGIDVRDNNRQAPQDFINDRHVTYPSIYDPAMRTLIAFGGKYPTSVIPSTLVLDRQHRVAAVFLRELLAADLQPVVERVAEEEPSGRAPVGAQ